MREEYLKEEIRRGIINREEEVTGKGRYLREEVTGKRISRAGESQKRQK